MSLKQQVMVELNLSELELEAINTQTAFNSRDISSLREMAQTAIAHYIRSIKNDFIEEFQPRIGGSNGLDDSHA